jgi:hypothetical protein
MPVDGKYPHKAEGNTYTGIAVSAAYSEPKNKQPSAHRKS